MRNTKSFAGSIRQIVWSRFTTINAVTTKSLADASAFDAKRPRARSPDGQLFEKPTDDEAVAAGFDNALDWYSYSTSGELRDPLLVKHNFDKMPGPAPEGVFRARILAGKARQG